MNISVLPEINVVLGVVCFVWLVTRTSRRWSEYPHEVRLNYFALTIVLLALLETSSEQIREEQLGAMNVFTILFAKCFALFALWKTRSTLYRSGTREPGNRDSDDPDKDITDLV